MTYKIIVVSNPPENYAAARYDLEPVHGSGIITITTLDPEEFANQLGLGRILEVGDLIECAWSAPAKG